VADMHTSPLQDHSDEEIQFKATHLPGHLLSWEPTRTTLERMKIDLTKGSIPQ